jgi:hypothetical protein
MKNTHRLQKDGRLVTMPVYVSNHITDEMLDWFIKSGQGLTVNAGRISEQVVLPYLEQHFGVSGETVDADGYDHYFENGIRNEHKKLVIRKTSAVIKHIGDNKEGKCDTISLHHPAQNVLYVIDATIFFKGIQRNYDKRSNKWDAAMYTDMALEGKGKRIGCVAWQNTKHILENSDVIRL